MYLGWQLFKHSVSMVLRNFQQVLQIFLLPSLLALALIFAAAMLLGVSLDDAAAPEGMQPGGFLLFPILVVILVLVMSWTVVAWHRFVLLEEYPTGWIPPFRVDRIIAYIGRSMLLMLAVLALALPLLAVMMATAAVPSLMFVAVGVGTAILYTIGLRLAVTLPAAATAKALNFSQALQETRGASWPIIAIVLCTMALAFLLGVIDAIFTNIPALYFLWAIPTQIFLSVLNVSVITTLYGYYVEKRQIV